MRRSALKHIVKFLPNQNPLTSALYGSTMTQTLNFHRCRTLPSTLAFEDIQEGDEADRKEEMRIPSERAVNGSWPVQKPITEDFWQSLNFRNDLSPQQKKQLIALLRRYPEVFPDKDGKLGHRTL